MYLKNIVLIVFLISNINFIFCKKEVWKYGVATEYGDTNGKWEVSDLEIGACDIKVIEKNSKKYNINYKDYIEFLTPNNEFKKNKDYDKKSQYFDPSSKTVALLNIDSKDDCGRPIELWYYKEDKNKNKTYVRGEILLVTDNCGSCKNKEQVDLPFSIWNKLYGKEIYKIGKNEGNKAPGEFNIQWRFFEKGDDIKLTKL